MTLTHIYTGFLGNVFVALEVMVTPSGKIPAQCWHPDVFKNLTGATLTEITSVNGKAISTEVFPGHFSGSDLGGISKDDIVGIRATTTDDTVSD